MATRAEVSAADQEAFALPRITVGPAPGTGLAVVAMVTALRLAGQDQADPGFLEVPVSEATMKVLVALVSDAAVLQGSAIYPLSTMASLQLSP